MKWQIFDSSRFECKEILKKQFRIDFGELCSILKCSHRLERCKYRPVVSFLNWLPEILYSQFHYIIFCILNFFIYILTFILPRSYVFVKSKVIYHPLYGMNNYVLIWGDWLSCDPLRRSDDSQSPHIRKHLCPILWQL